MTDQRINHDDDTLFTNRDVSEMVLRLAHEIRNPLAIIKSSVQLVRRLGLSAEKGSAYFDSALNQVERIHETLQEIEHYFSLQAGNAGVVSVDTAVTKALKSLCHHENANDRGLINGGGPPVRVAIDPENLQLGLIGLLENALDFSGAGSPITTYWESHDEMVYIYVENEGSGVSEKHAAHILRPFYSTSTHGIGLGLNVVQRVCTLVGGRLEWKNIHETGCRFTIVLREV